MIRSTALFLSLAMLPGLALSQEPATHTVQPGNTLWGLAERYYGDPLQWPRILEANRDRIDNPHRIFAGTVLRIPDSTGRAVEITVQPGPSGAPAADPSLSVPEVQPRTAFYRDTDVGVVGVGRRGALVDVPAHLFHSAPWLIPPGTVPERGGVVEGFAGAQEVRTTRTAARPFDRLQVRLEGPPPPVGSRLHAFRVERTILDVGNVVVPTGILVVEAAAAGGVVAVVESQFGLLAVGDLVRPLPPYTPHPADAPVPSTEGPVATALAFAAEREVQTIGGHAFLDVGANEGVSIGDEYVVLWGEGLDPARTVEGRVKVVAVLEHVSTARIVHLENPVFVPGVRLHPDRRVR